MITIRFKTPSKHRKGWAEEHHIPDYQSKSVVDAIAVVRAKYPDAYEIDAKVVYEPEARNENNERYNSEYHR
jgi:hypothetical protein